MDSRAFRSFVVVSALAMMSGCAFTQWTDRAFLGTQNCPPRHPNRQWAFATIIPFAVIGDIITAPAQQIMLVAADDGSLYAPSTCIDESQHQRELNASHY